jgi:hypothetical protein
VVATGCAGTRVAASVAVHSPHDHSAALLIGAIGLSACAFRTLRRTRHRPSWFVALLLIAATASIVESMWRYVTGGDAALDALACATAMLGAATLARALDRRPPRPRLPRCQMIQRRVRLPRWTRSSDT